MTIFNEHLDATTINETVIGSKSHTNSSENLFKT